MPFKLTKAEQAQRSGLETEFENAAKALIEDKTTATVEAFNDVVNRVNDFAVDVTNRLQEEFDDKSDNWKETEAGEIASAFLEQWECVNFEEIVEEDGEVDSGVVNDDLNTFADLPNEADE